MNLKPIASNMTEVEVNGYRVLFSYQTPVAVMDSLHQFFKTSKKWSATTTRHINKWLGGNAAQYKDQEFFDTFMREVK